MNKVNLDLLICVAWIAVWVGMAMGLVGEMPKNSSEPFSWAIPVQMAVLMGLPSVFAYMAGKASEKRHD